MEHSNKKTMAPKRLKQSRKKPRKRSLLPAGVAVGLVLAVYLILCFLAGRGSAFFPHTTLNGVDVAGLSAPEAASQVEELLLQRTCEIYLDSGKEPEASVTFAQLGVTEELGAQEMAQLALKDQQDRNFFSRGFAYLTALLGRDTGVQSRLSCNAAQLDATVEQLMTELTRAPQDTSYAFDGQEIAITAALDGRTLDRAALKTALEETVAESRDAVTPVELESQVLPAAVLTAQQVADAATGAMRNAGYDAATGTIYPEKVGASFDVAAAQKALDDAKPGETIRLAAEIQHPTVTAEQLRGLLFRDVLGECTTTVRGSNARRSNVRLASNAVNGTVLNSGEVFSYNGTTGKRTTAKGYQAAPAYVGGETVNEIGGGVCQPSSTLYLACLRSNLEITERHAHRYIPSYIPAGMDATVSWGGPDFKFRNNTDYPIKIVATYSGGQLTMKLLGTDIQGIRTTVTNEHLSTTPYEVIEQEDPSLAPGTTQVKTTPYTGHKYRTYRHVYAADGTLISSRVEATSNYKARNKVVLVGPKAPETPVDPQVPVTPETPVTPTPPVTPVEPPAVPETPETPAVPEPPAVPPEGGTE